MNDKYAFHWGLIETVEQGRPNLGEYTHIQIYRLMQYSLRSQIEKMFGTQATDTVFYGAGELAGRELCRNVLPNDKDLYTFINSLQHLLKELKVGILRIEEANEDVGRFVVTVEEDLDCSGLPATGSSVCVFDEGLLAGMMSEYTGERYIATEVDCWCTGLRVCRFEIIARREAQEAENETAK